MGAATATATSPREFLEIFRSDDDEDARKKWEALRDGGAAGRPVDAAAALEHDLARGLLEEIRERHRLPRRHPAKRGGATKPWSPESVRPSGGIPGASNQSNLAVLTAKFVDPTGCGRR